MSNELRIRSLLTEATSKITEAMSLLEPTRPVEPAPEVPVNSGASLIVWGEVRVSCVGQPAIFSGFFTERVEITQAAIRGGPQGVELIANGASLGMGPLWIVPPGSYQFIAKGGNQRPTCVQSFVARPKP